MLVTNKGAAGVRSIDVKPELFTLTDLTDLLKIVVGATRCRAQRSRDLRSTC